jgi:pimeloyl-ACP methyl ester carboxylesterase
MTFILFPGLGGSQHVWQNYYDDKINKLVKIDILSPLQKLGKVFVHSIPYSSVSYYDTKHHINKQLFKPFDGTLLLEDMQLDKYVKKLYDQLDKELYPPPYVPIGHSHGIYYAVEFARQYAKECRFVVSLDGSWLSKELLEKRLKNWRDKKKVVTVIENQEQLDDIVNKLKKERESNIYIEQIMNYIRYSHTMYAIQNNFEKLPVELLIFRDIFELPVTDVDKEFNNNAVAESAILEKANSGMVKTIWMPNATHHIWFKEDYLRLVMENIKLWHNKKIDGGAYYKKYLKYKRKYIRLRRRKN